MILLHEYNLKFEINDIFLVFLFKSCKPGNMTKTTEEKLMSITLVLRNTDVFPYNFFKVYTYKMSKLISGYKLKCIVATK